MQAKQIGDLTYIACDCRCGHCDTASIKTETLRQIYREDSDALLHEVLDTMGDQEAYVLYSAVTETDYTCKTCLSEILL